MSAPRIAVAQTGLANLASVLAGLRRVGAEPFATDDPVVFASASHAVLPGVGAFGPAMETIFRAGMDTAVRQRIENDRPLLCICLGMQLLGTGSEESPGVSGLGIVDARCERFGTDVRVPQLGWNRVRAPKGARFLRDGMAYFANSFRIRETPPGTIAARTSYGGEFVSAFERGSLLACQFHPELSGAWGLELFRRWIASGLASADDTGHGDGESDHAGGLARRVIPCLDCRNGRVVKGVRFQNLRDAGDPAELAAAYEAQGADEIVLLDVSATTDGRGTARETVARVREKITIPLTVGGGVRTVGDARALLEAGADKVAVNSAAVADPRLLEEIAGSFGRQCAVLAIDAAQRAADRWEVLVHSGGKGTGKDAVEWAREAESLGAGELLLTSWDRDGTRSGYDSALLRAVSAAVRIPVIASGGAASPEHFAQALETGADAVLAASIFHDGEYTVAEAKEVLARRGVEVRR